MGDGIYISCQPTGSSEEEMSVSYNKNTSTAIDASSMLNNPTTLIIVQVIIGCIIFIITFFSLNYAYNYLVSKPIKMPKFSGNT